MKQLFIMALVTILMSCNSSESQYHSKVTDSIEADLAYKKASKDLEDSKWEGVKLHEAGIIGDTISIPTAPIKILDFKIENSSLGGRMKDITIKYQSRDSKPINAVSFNWSMVNSYGNIKQILWGFHQIDIKSEGEIKPMMPNEIRIYKSSEVIEEYSKKMNHIWPSAVFYKDGSRWVAGQNAIN